MSSEQTDLGSHFIDVPQTSQSLTLKQNQLLRWGLYVYFSKIIENVGGYGLYKGAFYSLENRVHVPTRRVFRNIESSTS